MNSPGLSDEGAVPRVNERGKTTVRGQILPRALVFQSDGTVQKNDGGTTGMTGQLQYIRNYDRSLSGVEGRTK